MVDRFEYEKDRKCIVGGCINRSNEGAFNGPICTACESWLKVKDAADKFRTHGYRCPRCGQTDDIDNIGDGERCYCPKCDIDWRAPVESQRRMSK